MQRKFLWTSAFLLIFATSHIPLPTFAMREDETESIRRLVRQVDPNVRMMSRQEIGTFILNNHITLDSIRTLANNGLRPILREMDSTVRHLDDENLNIFIRNNHITLNSIVRKIDSTVQTLSETELDTFILNNRITYQSIYQLQQQRKIIQQKNQESPKSPQFFVFISKKF